MGKAMYCVTDTETGGLDERINPLLSVAILAADNEFEHIDGFQLKIKPPKNTFIEIPIKEHQTDTIKKKTIECIQNIYDKSTRPRRELPSDGYLINAVAAEINGYVTCGPAGWNMDAMDKWLRQAMLPEQAENTYGLWLSSMFPSKPIGVAHNATFDEKYLGRYLPKIRAMYFTAPPKTPAFASGWYCTCVALRELNKAKGVKGAALSDLAERAGHKADKAHDAMADCKTCRCGLRWLRTGLKCNCNG